MAESNVDVLLKEHRDDLVVQYATVEEVQLFIKEFNSNNSNINVRFMGPFFHSTNLVFRLDGVSRKMNPKESQILEDTLLDVLNPLDTDDVWVTGATVYFQQLGRTSRRRRLGQFGVNFVHASIKGSCRGCTSGLFSELIDDGFSSRADRFQSKLVEAAFFDGVSANTDNNLGEDDTIQSTNNTSTEDTNFTTGGNSNFDNYFNSVGVTVVSPIKKPSIINVDVQYVPTKAQQFPYWILVVLGSGVFIITIGLIITASRSKRKRLEWIALRKELLIREQQQTTMTSESRAEDGPSIARVATCRNSCDAPVQSGIL